MWAQYRVVDARAPTRWIIVACPRPAAVAKRLAGELMRALAVG
jgi:hypothetical protein